MSAIANTVKTIRRKEESNCTHLKSAGVWTPGDGSKEGARREVSAGRDTLCFILLLLYSTTTSLYLRTSINIYREKERMLPKNVLTGRLPITH